MSHTFRIPLTRTKADLLALAEPVLVKQGMNLVRTESGAEFSGQGFAGSLSFTDTETIVEITAKPFIVPWSLVESKLREVLAG